eukprot:5293055-Lingulodinium_polyedra.AAC.1
MADLRRECKNTLYAAGTVLSVGVLRQTIRMVFVVCDPIYKATLRARRLPGPQPRSWGSIYAQQPE